MNREALEREAAQIARLIDVQKRDIEYRTANVEALQYRLGKIKHRLANETVAA